MRRKTCIGIAVLLLLAMAKGAWADDPAEQQAKTAFERGKKAFQGLRYDEAAQEFRRAYKLKPSWKLLYNVGQAEASAKRYGLALEAFEQYLAEGGDDVPVERREEIIAELTRFKMMTGAIEVRAPAGAVIFVDDVERGKAPLPGTLKTEVGVVHTIRVELPGMPIELRTVQVSGGETAVVEFSKSAAPVPTAAPAPVQDVRKSTKETEKPKDTVEPEPVVAQSEPAADDRPVAEKRKTAPLKLWGWVTLGVGGALLAGGSVTGGMALALNRDLEGECSAANECLPSAHDKIDKRDALAMTTNVLYGVGAAAAVGGAVMLIIDAVSSKETTADVAAVPLTGPGLTGAALLGRF